MHAKRLLVVLTLGMCLLFAAGCAQQTKSTSSEDNTKPGQTEQAASTKNNAPADTSLDPLASITSSSRVVALSRSVGEMWLLAGGQLVGTTDDALDLPSLAGDCVSIGTLSKPSLEQVVACEPDLVMLTEDLSVHKELHQSLDEAGIPVLVVNIDSFDDYDTVMQQLTAATERDDLYQQNVADVRTQIESVIANATHEAGGTYLALRTSATKNKVLKSDNFTCDMLDDLGLSNVADDTSALDDLSLEAIADVDPDWIFVVYQGDEAEAQKAYEEAFSQNPVWSELSATKNGHVVVLSKELFQYKPNAKWGEAYAYLSQVLYGSWA